MRPETNELKDKLKKIKSAIDKIAFLKDKYKGQECYILTAGPSIKEYDASYINDKLKNKLVIAVKQTYNIAPDIVDFHLINPYNYKPYKYKGVQPITLITQIKGKKLKTPNSNEDLLFFIEKNKTKHKDALAYTGDFENYLLDKTLERPFGPGIMYELALYLAIHLGVVKINVLGWDLGSPKSDKIDRFYEKTSSFSDKLKMVSYKISPFFYNYCVRILTNKFRLFKYYIGLNYEVLNVPRITKDEAPFIAESTEKLYFWLNSKNIELNIFSSTSMISKIIPRKKL